MTPHFNARIEQQLAQRTSLGLMRAPRAIEQGNQTEMAFEEQVFTNFSSNDYLGLASSDELKQSYQQAVANYGVGSGASPLVTGYSKQHQDLSHALCEWLGYEQALFFSSGYAANQAVILSLLQREDLLLQDKLNHASLMEAGILSAATMKRYRHNDMSHFSKQLEGDRATLAITESVFSMDGDIAPIEQFLSICQRHNLYSMVDDAHGIGVLGSDGSGCRSLSSSAPDLLVVTFGKAFGLNGAAILCSRTMADYLTQYARHYIYSTAFSAAHAAALLTALNMIQTQHWRREKLLELSGYFDHHLSRYQSFVKTDTPIKPWIIGASEQALSVCQQLKQQQIWTTAIRPPTVAANSARIRITLSASHSLAQVKHLCDSLTRIMEVA